LSRRFFGTDGMRGVAGEFPLDRRTVTALGLAAGEVLGRAGATALIAADTRESGPWLASSLAEGLVAAGMECHYAGILPTPAVAHLTLAHGYTLGAVISASHNPYEDNGIKFFGPSGFKLPDETETRIEEAMLRILGQEILAGGEASGLPALEAGYGEEYLIWLLSKWRGTRLDGWRIVLDCANGAAFRLAPALFSRLGAKVTAIACSPTGTNINENCGSLHLDNLAREVAASHAHLGLAFDGDADRCIAVGPDGKVLDGDYVLYHDALWRKAEGRLPGNWVVGTVMSNLWLEQALSRNRIRFYRAPVGDRYVLSCLQDRGAMLGGEPSGHVLFLDDVTTGDGLYTGMVFASHARRYGDASALSAGIEPFPQKMVNLRVTRRCDLAEERAIQAALQNEEETLGRDGRIVLRFSGTEPVLRLMVEAKTAGQVDEVLARLSAVLYQELGKA
jgi:phosphoglucosamine mutase